MSGRVLVTGGTGNTGRAIARRLVELGFAVRVASRASATTAAQVRFDWGDEATHAEALRGVTRAYLVAPELVEDPARWMAPFVTRALAQGVRRLVLLSSSAISEGAPGLGVMARMLREQAPEWAVLRPSWFMQNFVDPRQPHAASLLRAGVVVTSTGTGRVGFVDAEDIAEVGARALADERSHDGAHTITGPAALSYAEVAEIVGRVTGRSFRHVAVSDAEARARLVGAGVPEGYAELLVGLDAAIRGGAEDRVTDTVLRVTGRAPRGFEEFVRAHASVFAREG